MSAALTDVSGALIIDKPEGMTSHDVVGKIRKLYGTRRVGHTGTLDPMATGVLVVLVGQCVKASDILMSGRKKYTARMKLGVCTDTEDTTGTVIETSDKIPAHDEVVSVAGSFCGDILQTPPMYSALKVGGKKLVDLARQGVTIDREPRQITVYSIAAEGSNDTYSLDIECSKGTYVRTLCADIGKKLGCGAAMSALRRTASGSFGINNAHRLEELEALSKEELAGILIPSEKLFEEYPEIKLNGFYSKLCINGCEIYQKKISTGFAEGSLVRIYCDGVFSGIGKVMNYPEGSAVKLTVRL